MRKCFIPGVTLKNVKCIRFHKKIFLNNLLKLKISCLEESVKKALWKSVNKYSFLERFMQIVHRKYKESFRHFSDQKLVEIYKETANAEIIGEIFERYQHIMFGVCLKYLRNADQSNDAVMHIFNELFDLLSRYEVRDLKYWLHTITKNHCLKILKGNEHAVDLDEVSEKNIAVDFMESEQELTHLKEKDLLLEKLNEALYRLKPEQQQCVKLFYIDSRSYQDIADITGYPLKKVKSYIQNGKRNLQLILEK